MRCSTTNAGVAFVEVKDRRARAERLQRANAADAEDDFLLDSRFAIAAVEPRRQLAVPRRVLFEIGVEQVQLHAADAHAPDGDQHRSSPSGTAVMHGLPSGVVAGSIGASAQLSRS